jgi:hypothetical protein
MGGLRVASVNRLRTVSFNAFVLKIFWIESGVGFPGMFVESRVGKSTFVGNSTLGGVTVKASSRPRE